LEAAVSGADDRTAQGFEPESDLEYDLAHEWTAEPDRQTPGQGQPVYVATETDDRDGDYGYDLAHDVPGR
jgi:hypothetical protein